MDSTQNLSKTMADDGDGLQKNVAREAGGRSAAVVGLENELQSNGSSQISTAQVITPQLYSDQVSIPEDKSNVENTTLTISQTKDVSQDDSAQVKITQLVTDVDRITQTRYLQNEWDAGHAVRARPQSDECRKGKEEIGRIGSNAPGKSLSNNNSVLCNADVRHEHKESNLTQANCIIPQHDTEVHAERQIDDNRSQSDEHSVPNSTQVTHHCEDSSNELVDRIDSQSNKSTLSNQSESHKQPDAHQTDHSRRYTRRKLNIEGREAASRGTSQCRKPNKRYICMYCGIPQSKLPRHLIHKHPNENDVHEYITCKKKNVREKILLKIRNIGNHKHNTKVIKEGRGEFKVVYGTSKEYDNNTNYLPCSYCLGYYVKTELWRHKARCPLNVRNATGNKAVASGKMLLPCPDNISKQLYEILAPMRRDKVYTAIIGDELITNFGEQLVNLHSCGEGSPVYVRNKVRVLGRLLLKCKEAKKSLKLKDLINPKSFQFVRSTARTLAGPEQTSGKLSKLSAFFQFGYSLMRCAKILKGKALISGDELALKKVEAYIYLHEAEWKSIESVDRPSVIKEYHTLPVLSLCSDVLKLTNALHADILKSSQQLLRNKSDTTAYETLSKSVITALKLVNLRRECDVSRMTLRNYYSSSIAEDRSDLTDSVSMDYYLLLNNLKTIEIVREGDKSALAILPKKLCEALKILVACRKSVGILKENHNVFAKIGYPKCRYHGDNRLLDQYSEACGTNHPEAIKSARLKRHVAVLSQLLNLEKFEFIMLRSMLGYRIANAGLYYRLLHDNIVLAKVLKLVLAIEDGSIRKNDIKLLDEITITITDKLDYGDNNDLENDIVSSSCQRKGKNTPETTRAHTGMLTEFLPGSQSGPSKRPSTFGVKRRRGWSEEETRQVNTYFARHMRTNCLPGRKEIEAFLEESNVNRPWTNVKDFVRNKSRRISQVASGKTSGKTTDFSGCDGVITDSIQA